MICGKVDHGVFIGKWILPPDSSIIMPADSAPLVLYVPFHHMLMMVWLSQTHPLFMIGS